MTYSPWGRRAEELAAWAWCQVNRADVWGGYNAVADWEKIVARADGTSGPLGPIATRPAKARRGLEFLTRQHLEEHFDASGPEHIVGLHATSGANLSRWGAVDVDAHGETSTPAEANLAACLAWYERLRGLGFRPLLTESNGRGGYHLRVLFRFFDAGVPTPHVFHFLKWLTADHAALGLPAAPETFPKQKSIERGRFGNWLRLPGRHYKRAHWSKVWNGQSWLEDEAAAEFMLSLAGDDPAGIPAAALPSERPAPPRPSPVWTRPAGDRLELHIRRYIDRMPTGLGEGMRRDDHAFRLAALLVHDKRLSEADALPWLEEWDGRQRVPKGEQRLKEIISNAAKYGGRSGTRGERRA